MWPRYRRSGRCQLRPGDVPPVRDNKLLLAGADAGHPLWGSNRHRLTCSRLHRCRRVCQPLIESAIGPLTGRHIDHGFDRCGGLTALVGGHGDSGPGL
jgi:hypothetical protein